VKFHFIASVEGDKESYKLIFNLLEELGCEPLNYHMLKRTIEEINKESPQESEEYTRNMTNWMQKSDFAVFEVTTNEFGCGCEMMIALEKCKPIIVLYQENIGRVPPTLKGFTDARVQIYSYRKDNSRELKQTLKMAVQEIRELTDIRFTLLLPPHIVSFLENISRKKKMPKSVFIRNLIQEVMEKEK
jgi:hypothetical protein